MEEEGNEVGEAAFPGDGEIGAGDAGAFRSGEGFHEGVGALDGEGIAEGFSHARFSGFAVAIVGVVLEGVLLDGGAADGRGVEGIEAGGELDGGQAEVRQV